MSLFVTSLNSGSNGNCYYIGNKTEAVLIDAGISCRETEKRMKLLGLSMKTVKAIFVSHEHTDHIKGVPVIAERFSVPVYITSSTLKGCCDIKRETTQKLQAYVPVHIGGLTIIAFPKHHDAEDPHSFTISFNGITVGVFTDIGESCSHVLSHFGKCHAAFLEANYDDELLEKGNYPYFLKNRIRGGKGHLSNKQALDIFTVHRSAFMSHLFLSHLSKENNCPAMVKDMFNKHAGDTNIIVASRYEQTKLYFIQDHHADHSVMIPVSQIISKQMSLF